MGSFQWPPSGSGTSGIATYASFGALPSGQPDGSQGITVDTDTLYIYNAGTTTWIPVGSPSTVLSLSAVGSSPNANAATITGNTLNLQPASGTQPGVVSTTTQTLAGNKTFSGTISASNLSGTNTGDQTITLTSDVTGSGTGSFATTVAKIQGTTVSGVTGSGNVVFSSAPTLSNPVVGTQSQGDGSTKAASTSYVDVAIANAIAGVNPAVAVQAATTAASDTSSFTYNNGVSGIGATLTGAVNTALTVDGYTFTALNQRLLVKNDTQSPSGAFNGVYYVTQVQTAILPLILTRALDYDTPSDMNNTGAIPVINGTVNGTTSWVMTALVVTVGTTPLTFVKFTRNPADYLLVANNLSDVGTKATAFNNVSPVTSTGDLIIGNGANSNTRLAVGTQYQTVQATATTVAYDAVHLDQAAAVTGVLPNANTTATSANTASKIVTRDGSGNFSAGTITAALTGTASGNTTYTANNHGVVLSGTTNAMTVVAPNASTAFPLVSGGASADPTWAGLTVAGGGTGATSATAYAVQCGGTTSTGAHQSIASVGTSGQVLTSNGAGALPTFQAAGAATVNSMIAYDTGNNYGSSNTRVRRFVNQRALTGTANTDWTYTDSATAGGSLTALTAGTYVISYTDVSSAADISVGVVVNGTAGTTSINGITYAQGFRGAQASASTGTPCTHTVSIRIAVNDVVWFQTNTGNNTNTNQTMFIVNKVSN